MGERVGRIAVARRRIRVPHLPPRRARARTRLLLGLPVQRNGRGRGRALPARLQGAQRPRRAGARRPVAHPAARRGDRPGRHPRGRRTRVATRPTPRCVPDRRRGARRDRGGPRSAHRADVPAFDRHLHHRVARIDLRVRSRSTDASFGSASGARPARLVRRARRGLAGPATDRCPERDHSRGCVRRRRRPRRAGGAPAPALGDRGRVRRARRHRDRRLTWRPARLLGRGGVRRRDRLALRPVRAAPRTAVAQRHARERARRRRQRAHGLLRCQHGRRHVVRRRCGARLA